MGWFNRNKEIVVASPQYSEIGNKLYDSLIDNPQDWEIYDERLLVCIQNKMNKIRIEGSFYQSKKITLYINNVSEECSFLTNADVNRLYDTSLNLARSKKEDSFRIKMREAEIKLIDRLSSSDSFKFDKTALSLAKAVINGDQTACCALIDYLLENEEIIRNASTKRTSN